MEFTLDYASLAKKLESQELDSPTGQASPQVYGQLLAIYLLFNDLTSAKFLWKRIAPEIKEANSELSTVWQVGKLMWKKNYSDIYAVINSCPVWPNHLKNIMNLILESTRTRAIELISRAYSTLTLEDASRLVGLTPEQTLALAAHHNWVHEPDTGYLLVPEQTSETKQRLNGSRVKPVGALAIDNGVELLEKLTDYIIFLESSTRLTT